MDSQPMQYALITPARNEEAHLEATIRSVVAQTVRPLKWVIVDDGSTDRTGEIAARYAARHDWMEVLRRPEHQDRQFAAKAHAFNAGFQRLEQAPYDIVGNLDADITFEPDYFQFLLAQFAGNPRLGVAGTPFVEDFDQPGRHTYAHPNANLTHVSGACQLFRKECFAQVGGYIPVKGGAIDWIAVTTARMKGWQTRTFTEKVCFHHRKLGTGTGANYPLQTRFHYGKKAYFVGGHPLWECSRGIFQMRGRPYLLAGAAFVLGYLWAAATRTRRPVSKELMAFHRAEQLSRFRRIFPFISNRKKAA